MRLTRIRIALFSLLALVGCRKPPESLAFGGDDGTVSSAEISPCPYIRDGVTVFPSDKFGTEGCRVVAKEIVIPAERAQAWYQICCGTVWISGRPSDFVYVGIPVIPEGKTGPIPDWGDYNPRLPFNPWLPYRGGKP